MSLDRDHVARQLASKGGHQPRQAGGEGEVEANAPIVLGHIDPKVGAARGAHQAGRALGQDALQRLRSQ